MTTSLHARVTLVGAGIIGRGWIRVFARHGVPVTAHHPKRAQIDQTLGWLAQDLAADVAAGFLSAEARERMLACTRGRGRSRPRSGAGGLRFRKALPKSLH
ncbi:3-hydroxyacyl-CoA dehydrogenase NAD-binding domain-containing protein [Taklimakanibacter deserti]|uniref:3-hydroxyacyl-CoA dehydrogenase NAD-binding domain-containing protein n=1 Tax=Taklimakanibacter deserti TaxID=2267839 RepID=UPI000E64F23D